MSWKLKETLLLLSLSFNANAVIINTLDGVEYQWLELGYSYGMTRDQVNAALVNPTSNLYGYHYATRSQLELLLNSYVSWDGINGLHGNETTLSGIDSFMSDFGFNYALGYYNTRSNYTVDTGQSFSYNGVISTYGLYGSDNECALLPSQCYYSVIQLYQYNTVNQAVDLLNYTGWDSQWEFPLQIAYNNLPVSSAGSYLVRPTAEPLPPPPNPVPVPAAAFLFLSGLLGLIASAVGRSH